MKRVQHIVTGQVQGVGFRPYVYLLAERYNLAGYVKNSSEGVIVEVQGSECALESFAKAFVAEVPPLAQIDTYKYQEVAVIEGQTSFAINQTSGMEEKSHAILVSPDISICKDCIQDMDDPHGRRKEYAFTNCTNCGPRYTITQALPYDRETTSMACFPLCEKCKAEYDNPRDRRFHAQPNACPLCGPKMWFTQTPCDLTKATVIEKDAIAATVELLLNGGIAAIKGLGGFHLVCDASHQKAVASLRQKKNRPDKPLAVMTNHLESARCFAVINPVAENLLLSAERPVTLCTMHKETSFYLASNIAPGVRTIGIMLPYTPLHRVLLEEFAKAIKSKQKDVPVLVMTSGNRGGEPISLGNREALVNLEGIADGWLLHNRDILNRIDDSVVLPLPLSFAKEQDMPEAIFFRRARGYVPRPLPLTLPIAHADNVSSKNCIFDETIQRDNSLTKKENQTEQINNDNAQTLAGVKKESALPIILGVGAEKKSTFCITKGENAFVSQHIGDLANIETEQFYAETQKHLSCLLAVQPQLVVRDLHPNFFGSNWAKASTLPVMALQHHAAHAFSVLGENKFMGKAVVLALDGSGFGSDGEQWGGEALLVDMNTGDWQRAGHLSQVCLPGGEAAIKEPWRIAHALLVQRGLSVDHAPWLPAYASIAENIPFMIKNNVNIPRSTSCGRLFDAVSALLGACLTATYEGQAAIVLEQSQWLDQDFPLPNTVDEPLLLKDERPYGMPLTQKDELYLLDSGDMFEALQKDRAKGDTLPQLARRFHQSLAKGLCELVETICRKNNVEHVGLSGGVMQNSTLLYLLIKGFKERGLVPLVHKTLPPGDGSISFGQTQWAAIKVFSSITH